MKRAVVYARYSTDNQRVASIGDQVELCRRYIERQGWTFTETYDDAAVSGASRFRPGFARLTADAEAGKFDILVCAAIDRLGRKLADVADLFDRLTFHGVQIHTTSIGIITQMHVGIMGTMAQMTLADLRDKTKRGQLGRARLGKVPGGLAFGYDVVPPAPGVIDRGERRINEAEANIVRRIFRAYAGRKSARIIARELNQEGVPGPHGRPWIDTTIRGQEDRGTGLINNTLYIGQLSWNRCSYVKDPRTGKRVARVNAASEREIVAVPELRIVDQELWDQVKARQAAIGFEISADKVANRLSAKHRPQFLLSGLLLCGCCGGGYTIIGKDRYGCATRRGKGTCSNGQTIMRQHIEARVLEGLRENMLTADAVSAFISEFAAALADLERQAGSERRRLSKELDQVERRLGGVLRAIEDGAWNDTLRARLTELEASKTSLARRLRGLKAPPPGQLHPNAAAIYRDRVAALQNTLAGAGVVTEAATVLRELIEQVVLTPDVSAPDRLRAELHGDLATILSLASSPSPERAIARSGSANGPGTSVPGSLLSVVAGARNHLDLLLSG
jgi:DNA invertase Pin-like site-specific DNA recombinase